MSFPEKIRRITVEAIHQLVEDYQLDAEQGRFLTENDAACRLFALLDEKSNAYDIGVHSELRPFCCGDHTNDVKNCLVIRENKDGKIAWDKQGDDAKNGSRVDICLISQNGRYLKKAKLKAKFDQLGPNFDHAGTDLKYWRILSYPVEAFQAAIEIKIKVHKNMTRIKKDIEKMAVLKQNNDQCQTYLVVLDRQADHKYIEKIKNIAHNRDPEINVQSCTKR